MKTDSLTEIREYCLSKDGTIFHNPQTRDMYENEIKINPNDPGFILYDGSMNEISHEKSDAAVFIKITNIIIASALLYKHSVLDNFEVKDSMIYAGIIPINP